jgi:hypothetical protein
MGRDAARPFRVALLLTCPSLLPPSLALLPPDLLCPPSPLEPPESVQVCLWCPPIDPFAPANLLSLFQRVFHNPLSPRLQVQASAAGILVQKELFEF